MCSLPTTISPPLLIRFSLIRGIQRMFVQSGKNFKRGFGELEIRRANGQTGGMAHFGTLSRFRGGALLLASLCLLVPCKLPAGEPGFRFAWLSDTHVGSTTGEEDLRQAVRDINSATG